MAFHHRENAAVFRCGTQDVSGFAMHREACDLPLPWWYAGEAQDAVHVGSMALDANDHGVLPGVVRNPDNHSGGSHS